MTLSNHLLALLCIVLMATGQVLFKLTANTINATGTMFDRGVLSLSLASLVIYAIATVFWVYLLQSAPLSRAYPYVALSFVTVAFVSWLFFHETITGLYVVGLGLIVIGITFVAAAG